MSQNSHTYTITRYCQHTSSAHCRICGKEIPIASIGTINAKSIVIDNTDDANHQFDMCINHNRRSIETYLKNNL